MNYHWIFKYKSAEISKREIDRSPLRLERRLHSVKISANFKPLRNVQKMETIVRLHNKEAVSKDFKKRSHN